MSKVLRRRTFDRLARRLREQADAAWYCRRGPTHARLWAMALGLIEPTAELAASLKGAQRQWERILRRCGGSEGQFPTA